MRRHIAAFLAVAGGLVALNWALGGYWWSLWVAAAWGAALAVHALILRSRAADEDWAEARAADLHSKSYDASHIDSIADRYKGDAPPGEAPPAGKDKAG